LRCNALPHLFQLCKDIVVVQHQVIKARKGGLAVLAAHAAATAAAAADASQVSELLTKLAAFLP
jgi:hypothetical protein